MPDKPGLDRRQFLGLLAAALGTGTTGVLDLVLQNNPAHAARPAAGSALQAAQPNVAAPPSTAIPVGPPATTAAPASAGHKHQTASQAQTRPDPPPPLPVDQRTLVLITLYGGNDALNTVIPYRDPRYYAARGKLAVPASTVLPLGDGLGLHPNLKGMHSRWDAQEMAIVRGIGYPNPNRSHFVSMDIWQTASVDAPASTGWLGRWLDAGGTDPAQALVVGSSVPILLRGARRSAGAIPPGPFTIPAKNGYDKAFQAMMSPTTNGPFLPSQVAAAGANLLALSHMLAGDIGDGIADSGTAALEADAGAIGDALGLVARLVRAEAHTKVYSVSMGGFDTHGDQAEPHGRLLGQLDAALTAFWASLQGHPRRDGVVVAVYSEFGRRVQVNGSEGTDHGKAGDLLLFGAPVKAGFHGDEPDLGHLLDGDLAPTTDFRSVYAALLGGVIGSDPTASLGRGAPPALDILR